MKKILSIMLCAVMLIGTMMSVVTAAVPENGWELAEYGQKTYYTGAPVDAVNAPIVDGVINEGEYTTAFVPYVKGTSNDSGFWTRGNDCDNVEIFTCRDDEYLYFGIRFYNKTIVSNEEKIVWNDHSERICIQISPDATNMKPNEKCSSAVDYEPDCSISNNWGKFDSFAVNIVDNVVTFECSYEIIGILDNWGLDEIERLYIVVIISSANSHTAGDGDELWYAFTSRDADLQAKHTPIYADPGLYPHVVVLSADPDAAPVETEPAETEPTETEPTETEPTETEPTETEPVVETEPTETEATGTDKPDDAQKEGGCGSSITAMGIALVATLGTAITVVAKKKED